MKNTFCYVAVRTGLEPVTPCVTGMYSNTQNYIFSYNAPNINDKNF